MNDLNLYEVVEIQLIYYIILLIWAYYDLKNKQRRGELNSVTIQKVLGYWPTEYYIPVFGIFVNFMVLVIWCIITLVYKFTETKLYEKILNILDKEI